MKYTALVKILPYVGIFILVLGVCFNDILIYPGVHVVIAFFAIGVFVYLEYKLKWLANCKSLIYLGKNSLYIYLMHNYFTVLFRTIYRRLDFEIRGGVYVVGNTIMTIILCLLVCELVKKVWLLDIVFKPIKTVKRVKENIKQ